ncbi:hypothetical protein GALL_508390 [mine drainage metagenome]|uniref:Uncharacterized protein n=1 Tax=mine drainage metagenome TaxID=410659 RepID=A0A1J5PVG7_9ZZZZ
MGQIDLAFHLRSIASVDENPGDMGQCDAEPRRAGKAGQPLQTFVVRGDIFALMHIGARDQKAAKPF